MAHFSRKLETKICNNFLSNKDIIRRRWFNQSNFSCRYFYIDDFIESTFFNKLVKSLHKDLNDINHFKSMKSFRERKKTTSNLSYFNSSINQIHAIFQNENFINCLQETLNISSLQSDPENYAGGLSLMNHGDFLNPHLDNSHSKDRTLYRRLNLLFYIHENNISKGGELELWNSDVTKANIIKSVPNRLVVMETDQKSWHSVSKIIAKHSRRICLSAYYYSPYPANNIPYQHVTSFTGRPSQKILRFISPLDNFFRENIRKLIK